MSDRDRRLSELMELRGSGYNNGVIIWWTETQDFSTPEWRAMLMDWAVEQEWWVPFVVWVKERYEGHPINDTAGMYSYIWSNLPDLVHQYWNMKCTP